MNLASATGKELVLQGLKVKRTWEYKTANKWTEFQCSVVLALLIRIGKWWFLLLIRYSIVSSMIKKKKEKGRGYEMKKNKTSIQKKARASGEKAKYYSVCWDTQSSGSSPQKQRNTGNNGGK